MTGQARFVGADRAQLQWDMLDLESLLAIDHRARIVWGFVESLDLSALYDAIGAREGEAGRPPPDPAVLMALWLYATIEGVGSARQLERLCGSDVAYRWLAGGVPLNYHGLADFRVEHGEVLDRLLSESVTALICEGLVKLTEIAVDGTKLRANAGKGSFKSRSKLEAIETRVCTRIAALRAETESDPEASSRRKRAAQERAAREVMERTQKARAALERLQKEKAERSKTHAKAEAKKPEPRVSLTDLECRCMRFADGAVRPAYNAQIAAAPRQGVIVAVSVTDRRNDSGLAVPMVEEVANRYGEAPKTLLADTHYATKKDIVALSQRQAGAVEILMPPPPEKTHVKPETLARRERARAREAEPLRRWRQHMESEEGKQRYRLRNLIERLNADAKNRGFGRLPVRGLIKAKTILLWYALANNLMAAHRLRMAPA
jgi:transposase